MHKKLDPIEKKIAGVKEELMTIGEMRPGSLTYQYQRPKEKNGGFYQISYTYRMKSKTEYVKAQFVQDFKRQIATFKRINYPAASGRGIKRAIIGDPRTVSDISFPAFLHIR